ncbi:MAG: beta-N-acetylhexosaminidase, partial [Rikenellaceae bacterium]
MNLKKIYTIALSLSMAVISVITSYASEINLIPKPQKLEITEGENYTITSKTTINYSEELKDLALLLSDYIYAPTGIKLETTLSSKGGKNTIQLAIDNSIESREGYILDITSKGVTIKAKTGAGAFYGVQTLLQLLPAQIESEKLVNIDLTLPAVAISDQPQFEWRGVMLDVSRYFYSKDFVLRFIDMMSMYKMNTLHFHLVDDSGWRLEIKKYPLLTSIGAFAGEGENRTGGFYTQDDIKEMIKYGELRGVEIIPEIEFPAHMLSAVVAYPWLSCRDEQLKMPLQHYISKDLICVGQERSIEFLKDVLEETFELFPSKYVHIGGDEAVYTYWESCPHCQEIMKKEGLSRAAELQAYLTNIVAEIAEKHGRTIVGWDEILERGKVDKPVVSMIWRNINNVEHVLNSEHMAVLTPVQSAYFDMPENRLPGQIQAATWSNPISVERCYSFETAKFEGNAKILGVQASMWSDQFINGTTLQEISLLNENRSENYVEYLMLPRLLAMAEVCWTPNSERDFKDFDARLSAHYTRLGCAGFNYCIPVPEV